MDASIREELCGSNAVVPGMERDGVCLVMAIMQLLGHEGGLCGSCDSHNVVVTWARRGP